MPTENVTQHRLLCEELNKLYERKNHDYGDSFHQTFLEEGFAMPRIRLHDKFSRFKTLSRLAGSVDDLIRKATDSDTAEVLSKKQRVTDESIRDTLIDLANYSLMTVMEIDRLEAARKEAGGRGGE